MQRSVIKVFDGEMHRSKSGGFVLKENLDYAALHQGYKIVTRRTCLLFLVLYWSFTAHAFNWSNLWFTPDQQGQVLMQKKEFKQAETTFKRTDWAAAAAYKAGNYKKAGELFKNLNTEQGFYNQGNALAKQGQYEQAIKAYDQALAINPKDQDAIFNRELIRNLMKNNQQNQNQQNQNQQNQNQQNQNQQNQNQQNQNQQNQNQQNQNQQNQNQQNQNQQNQNQQNQNQQNQNQQNQNQQNQNQQNQNQQNQNQQNQNQQNQNQQNQNQQNQNQQNQNQQNQNQQSKDQQHSASKKEAKKQQNMDNPEQAAAASAAEQEQQQAQQQWLRLIPDDPGGLLREKFLRDHLRRESRWNQ